MKRSKLSFWRIRKLVSVGGKAHRARVWEIVDLGEVPHVEADLQRGQSGLCRVDGALVFIDSPLLIYSPGAKRPLVFVPSSDGDADEECTRLVRRLRERARESGRRIRTTDLTVCARAFLPVLFCGDPAVRALCPGVVRFVSAYDVDEMEDAADAHPELLTSIGLEALKLLLSARPLNVTKTAWVKDLQWRTAHLASMIDLRATQKVELFALNLRRALHRYVDTRAFEDLAIVETQIRALVKHKGFAGAPQVQQQAFLHLAGRAQLAVFVRKGRGLAYARRLLLRAEGVSATPLERADIMDTLAIGLAERAGFAGGRDGLLDEAFKLAGCAVSMTPRRAPERAAFLRTLANVRLDLYRRMGTLSDLNAAVRCAEEAADLARQAPGDRGMIINVAGAIRAARFERLGRIADLDAAISYAREALQLMLGPEAVAAASALARHLIKRFEWTGEPSDLLEAVETAREVAARTPPDHPNRASHLHTLVVGLGRAFEVFGDEHALKESLERAREAVDLAPAGHPDRAGYLNCLANQLTLAHRRYNRADDLEEAVRCGEEALALVRDDAPDRRDYLRAAALLRQARYEWFGELEDIDRAVDYAQAALRRTPEKYAHRSGVLNALSTVLALRFERLGRLADLDLALSRAREAVSLTHQKAIERPLYLNDLSNLYGVRFSRVGAVADLDAAIAAIDEAAACTRPEHDDHAMLQHARAGRYFERFVEAQSVKDLAVARICAERAVNRLPKGHPDHAIYLNTLAVVCEAMFRRTGERGEIDIAVSAARDAVEVAGLQHPARVVLLNTLATVLSQRFNASQAARDLNLAIETSRTVVRLTRANDPQRIMWLYNYAQHIAARFGVSRRNVDLMTAHRTFAAASRLARRGIVDTTQPGRLARRAAEIARDHVALLWNGRRFEDVVGVIEASRGIRLKAELVRADRSALISDPERRRAHGRASRQLRAARLNAEAIRSAGEHADERVITRLGLVSRQIIGLEAKLARWEGGADDAPAMRYLDIVRFARRHNETIVYLLPVDEVLGALWIIVHPKSNARQFDPADAGMVSGLGPETIKHLMFGEGSASRPGWFAAHRRWLDAKSGAEADRAEKVWRSTVARVLRILGARLMTPLGNRLAALGVSRVVLAPCGDLGVVPLQGAPLTSGEPFGERFETRFAPSAEVLARAHSALRPLKAPAVLAMANPHLDLPFAERQCLSLRSRRNLPSVIVRTGERATKAFLTSNARRADYLELATHAHFAVAGAASSYFEFAGAPMKRLRPARVRSRFLRPAAASPMGDRLTLTDIWSGALRLKRGAIVGASACETGLASVDAGDSEEHLGFTTAFLAAGASSVMGSFWAVSDFAAYMFMERFHELLLGKGETPALAVRGAAQYLRALRSHDVLARLEDEITSATLAMTSAASKQRDNDLPDATRQRARRGWYAAYRMKRLAEAERARVLAAPKTRRPFAHPYYYAAFALHGADTRPD